jgi:hypothetical protein
MRVSHWPRAALIRGAATAAAAASRTILQPGQG